MKRISTLDKKYKEAQAYKNKVVSSTVENLNEVSFKMRDASTEPMVNIVIRDGVFYIELHNGCTMSEGAEKFIENMNLMIPDMLAKLGYIKI